MSKKLRATLAMMLSFVMFGSIVACGGDSDTSSSKPVDSSTATGGNSSTGDSSSTGGDVETGKDVNYEDLTIKDANLKQATYNTLTSVMPSNWNELTYADNNDTQIMSYIGSGFFDYDYDFGGNKYNEDGTINKDAIVAGSFATTYSAATKLEDVTSTVAAKWGYTTAQKDEGGYAWKITLRDDLKWDDGTPIKAADFVYSMDQQLDPDFMNFRADTYYDTLKVKNARAYFYKNQKVIYNTIGSMGYESNAAAVAAGAAICIDVYTFYNAQGYVDAGGKPCPQWVSITDETIYNAPEAWADPENKEIQDAFSGKELWEAYFAPETGVYAGYVEVGQDYEGWLGIGVVNENTNVEFSDVGMYEVEGENAFVICFDKSYSFLKDDGTLSYLSAYYMQSLPLVKKDLYESCKIAPETGSTLWTSNYNSSLETTASWGPYKLTMFQAGKAYKLEKNENWYGYNMNLYKNQYNVTAINCELVENASTQWLKFIGGEVDDGALMKENIDDYLNSKYVTWIPDTGTYGMQVYGNKTVLANSSNNNSILAIDKFRQALSLSLDRNEVVNTVWPGSSLACYGIMNNMYYYDVLNGGKYRETDEAKEALLRAYGFTQAEDGTWSTGDLTDMDLEEAYSVMTGYDPALAKQYLLDAYKELTSDESYNYDPNKNITIVFGSSVDTAKQRERMNYLQSVVDTLCKDTPLEGKIKFVFDASAGAKWADAFRAGDTQIAFGAGFTGNPFNPFNIAGLFVDKDNELNYHKYWDTSSDMLTLTLPEGDYTMAGETITMSLENWYFCLNGLGEEKGATYTYNWDEGKAPANARLYILAALEEQVIKKSYSIMLIGEYSGSFLGEKFSYISYDYNTFNSFGGIRYLEVNYTDAEWAAFVKANNNDLSSLYKQAK